VPGDRAPGVRVVFKVADAGAVKPDPAVKEVSPFEDTHWGTQQMVMRDPDGRLWSLEAPRHG
jgi:uncharacterized glyoxalase superfamily protein PhnB